MFQGCLAGDEGVRLIAPGALDGAGDAGQRRGVAVNEKHPAEHVLSHPSAEFIVVLWSGSVNAGGAVKRAARSSGRVQSTTGAAAQLVSAVL